MFLSIIYSLAKGKGLMEQAVFLERQPIFIFNYVCIYLPYLLSLFRVFVIYDSSWVP